MDIGESRHPQDGTLTWSLSETTVDLRISTLPVRQSESLAVRLLPHNRTRSLNDLLLFPHQVKTLQRLINRTSGIILLTGPTGSGKTTLLYSLIDYLLEQHAYQTISLEDPIEKDMKNFLQVQINEKSGMTYQTGLKAALRHDPDIIMVGEIRDDKTAEFVFHAAYTGHLVFSTLHAKNAVGTIHRLIEMGVKPIDIEQNLIGICAIELLPLHLQQRRAGILEILAGAPLERYMKNPHILPEPFVNFKSLKRKAYAYGYIDTLPQ